MFWEISLILVKILSERSLKGWRELKGMIGCTDWKWEQMECKYTPHILVWVVFVEFGHFPITDRNSIHKGDIVREENSTRSPLICR